MGRRVRLGGNGKGRDAGHGATRCPSQPGPRWSTVAGVRSLDVRGSRGVRRLLSRMRAWIGGRKLRHEANAADSNRSDLMPAMSHTRQMEQVLESLAAKSVEASEHREIQSQWRLVSLDGSTSSVDGPRSAPSKRECPDCLAGHCGQNAAGCRCSGGEEKTTISLEGLDETAPSRKSPHALGTSATNAAMPRANPRLFEETPSLTPSSRPHSPACSRPSCVQDEPPVSKREAHPLPGQALPEKDGPSPTVIGNTKLHTERPTEDLQQVIDQWPRLNGSTRRAILALVDISGEANRA